MMKVIVSREIGRAISRVVTKITSQRDVVRTAYFAPFVDVTTVTRAVEGPVRRTNGSET